MKLCHLTCALLLISGEANARKTKLTQQLSNSNKLKQEHSDILGQKIKSSSNKKIAHLAKADLSNQASASKLSPGDNYYTNSFYDPDSWNKDPYDFRYHLENKDSYANYKYTTYYVSNGPCIGTGRKYHVYATKYNTDYPEGWQWTCKYDPPSWTKGDPYNGYSPYAGYYDQDGNHFDAYGRNYDPYGTNYDPYWDQPDTTATTDSQVDDLQGQFNDQMSTLNDMLDDFNNFDPYGTTSTYDPYGSYNQTGIVAEIMDFLDRDYDGERARRIKGFLNDEFDLQLEYVQQQKQSLSNTG